MSHTEQDPSPIDAVITWVDGNDPAHRRRRVAALRNRSPNRGTPVAAGRHETRFTDNGELRYCLAALHKFAPWIRQIHLITDRQTPAFLTPELREEYRVRYVDHQDIFESHEWALPTFNSRTIETALWRTPDISDRFLYLNDDFLITRELTPDDFFIDGKTVIRGAWRSIHRYGIISMRFNQLVNVLAEKLLGRTRTMHPLAQMNAARLVGFDNRYFHTPHLPHPIRTGTLSRYFEQHPDLFSRNIGYAFRDINQYWPISLAYHLEIALDRAVLTHANDAAAINGERHSPADIRKKLSAARQGQVRFLVLTALECTGPTIREEIETTLQDLLDL